jgi:hypothetical protein
MNGLSDGSKYDRIGGYDSLEFISQHDATRSPRGTARRMSNQSPARYRRHLEVMDERMEGLDVKS